MINTDLLAQGHNLLLINNTQLCRAKQGPDDISDLMGVIDMKGIEKRQ
jgi:hypothetical protein